MALIIDFLLLAASGAACFYCWILSSKLKALTDTKDGLSTGIAALSQSTEEIQAALSQTKQATEDNASYLSTLIDETEKKIPELKKLLGEMSTISTQAADDTEQAATKLVEALKPHIEDAKQSAAILLDSLDKKAASTENTANESTSLPTGNPGDDAALPEAATDEDEIVFIVDETPSDEQGVAA